ncbi:ATP-dependent Lon protease [Methylomarinovum caldicuralii]|uniref:Lon protease n=1 Tax=Methylomarinovum caldicuralii TaxID=438856 RepID=A0AAU9C866_9GAMM|nr:endopeptidase La [Methylomarinovum caldicuralii]BCX82229.1 ATP-dependent Lon protease [Methylomarinovum caldicuralii]
MSETQNQNTEKAPLQLPEGTVPIIPVRNVVLFPGVIIPLSIGRDRSIAAAQQALKAEQPVGLLLQKDPGIDNPMPSDLHPVGTTATILRYVTGPDGTHHIVVQGEERFRVKEFKEGYPFLVAEIEPITSTEAEESQRPEVEARMVRLKELIGELLELMPQAPSELVNAVQQITDPATLADMIAAFIDIEAEEKQKLLETLDVAERLDKLLDHVAHRLEVLKLSKELSERTKKTMDERQREYLLREQLKTIQRELGEEEEGADIEELRQAIEEAGMPEEVKEHALKELKRLERMHESQAEYGMLRTYLEWLIELPWSKETEEKLDIKAARRILDEDHHDLEKVKRRILEYLAVRKLNPQGKGPILCFVGPPGVGKTSLGQSIAKATGRKFVRVALGGVHDEAEIRGHRRTYIGAMPGKIIQAIRKAGARNCVMMLDEIDKLGMGAFHGDPAAALLEVLDPEQNASFVDNYLGVPFDLSKVMFICTANVLDTIPRPLLDRMELIEIPGYTETDKLHIARRYLVRRQLEACGLKPEQVEITAEAIRTIIRHYTREAGVRNLEREIGAVFRWAAVQIAEGKADHIRIDADDIQKILGPPRYENEVAMRTSVPGVATGLAWTPVGGDILFIEATKTPGNGKLILTGHLGDVMKESAQAALTLVKARSDRMGIDPKVFSECDVHVHVPAGATPKDGPSAGVAIFVALVSLFTDKPVRPDVAMTGEISLRGLVLPVGGIKEKVLAALQAGIETVMLPARNKKEWEDIPEEAREKLRFVWLENVDQAIVEAIGPEVLKP